MPPHRGAEAPAAAHADAADRAPPGTHRGHEAKQRAAEGVALLSVKAAVGFEPTNNGFAIRPLRPLGYAAGQGPYGGTRPVPRQRGVRSAAVILGRIDRFPASQMPNFPPIALASLLIALAASPCSAQFGRSSDAFGSGGMFPNNAKQPAPAAGDLVRKQKQDPLPQLPNAPIIREGVFFSSVKGYFAPSLREPGLLTFRVDERRTASTRRYLTVFPCDAAEDIKAILADPRADSPSLFEVTGDVYEMHGRAYLLPIAVVALRAPDAPGMIARNEPKELQRAMARAQGPRAPRIDAYADLSAAERATAGQPTHGESAGQKRYFAGFGRRSRQRLIISSG